jgi:ATP-binding cassette, subfamily B, multidrug efflux pump
MKKHGTEGGFDRSSFRLLVKLLLRHRKAIAWGIAALILVDCLQLIIPKITQHVIDRLAGGIADRNGIALLGAGIVAVSLGMALCRFAWRYFIMGSSLRIERDLRQDLYDHLQRMSPQFFDRTKVGDLMAHATNDLGAVRMAVGMGTLASFDAFVLAVASLSIMMTMDVRLTLVTLIPLPLLTIVMFRFGRLVHSGFTSVQEAFSSLTDRAQESFSGIRVVKAYGDEESERRYFAERAETCARENIRLGRIWGFFEPLIGSLAMTSMVILLGAGGRMVIRGEVTLGEFVAFSSYLGTLIWPMMAVGWVVNLVQRGTASMVRLQKIFSTPPDITDGSLDGDLRPAIEVRDLTFTYPGTDARVLDGVSFELPAGSVLGVVGRTGCGKTTLVELLMRLYDPPRGTVFIDGCDVLDLGLDRVRGLFGYVPQETFLFAMSVSGNISFGSDSMPLEEVEGLAREVEIHTEIEKFPQGYETLVGERGVTLSGGQKQRIAIARALAVDPRILVLDDSLSSVDTETEAAILASLTDRMKGRTSIVIAHRISTVRRADLIIVIDRGRIIESGTHESLLAADGFYAELFHMQQLEEEARRTGSGGGAD